MRQTVAMAAALDEEFKHVLDVAKVAAEHLAGSPLPARIDNSDAQIRNDQGLRQIRIGQGLLDSPLQLRCVVIRAAREGGSVRRGLLKSAEFRSARRGQDAHVEETVELLAQGLLPRKSRQRVTQLVHRAIAAESCRLLGTQRGAECPRRERHEPRGGGTITDADLPEGVEAIQAAGGPGSGLKFWLPHGESARLARATPADQRLAD